MLMYMCVYVYVCIYVCISKLFATLIYSVIKWVYNSVFFSFQTIKEGMENIDTKNGDLGIKIWDQTYAVTEGVGKWSN